MQMFHHFRGRDEVVGVFEYRCVRGIERVVKGHGMAGLFEHHRQGRSGAASKIEAPGTRGQSFMDREKKSA